MNYTFSQIKATIERIVPSVVNQRILKIRNLCSSTWSFQLSSLTKTYLVISVLPQFPFVDLTSREMDFDLPLSHFQDSLKQTLTRCIIDNIFLAPNDRVVCLSLHRFTEAYKEVKFNLYIELVSNRTNLILTDHSNKIILVLNPSSLDSKRPLLIGLDYSAPQTNNNFSSEINNEKPLMDIDSYLASLYQANLNEKYYDTIDFLNKRMKLLSRKLEKFEEELVIKNKYLEYKTIGNLLLTYQSSLIVEDVVEIEGQKIKLDKTLSVVENANHFFKIYHKSQAALIAIARESRLAHTELEKVQDIFSKIPSYSENDFLKLATSVKFETKAPTKKNKKIEKSSPNEPYHLVFKGTKLSFGKNRFQNDRLTFTIAKATDWFFHSKDSSGAHVILHHETPTPLQLQIAAEVALVLSHQDGGEVIYAQVKTLKKGGKPGLVITSTYKTYRIVAISEEIKNAMISSNR